MKEPSTFDLIFATSALLVHVEKLSASVIDEWPPDQAEHKAAVEAQVLASGIRASWPDTFRKPSEPLAPLPIITPDCPHFSGMFFREWRGGKPNWTYKIAGAPEICHCKHPDNLDTHEGNCQMSLCPLGRKDPEAQ